jgi:L-ribulose-5-phosphate 3-epimerase
MKSCSVSLSKAVCILNRENITINLDIGNSASLGFDPVTEQGFRGDLQCPIKDRILGNDSVAQGKGSENFDRFFDKLREFDYSLGLIIKGSILLDVYGGAS